MTPTFEAQGDEMPPNKYIGRRQKYINSVGVVGQTYMTSTHNHPFTGMFLEGADSCYVRLSQAKEVERHHYVTSPSLGFKCLRDGRDSANLVAMVSPNGQAGWNFFENDLKTMLPREDNPDMIPLARKFATATPYMQSVGTNDWGWFD